LHFHRPSRSQQTDIPTLRKTRCPDGGCLTNDRSSGRRGKYAGLISIDEAVHSSSDGQQFEAAIPTINARPSSSYFGLSKCVAAYTLVANHVPLNARIIGANKHESHYVFDILLNPRSCAGL